MHTPGPWTYETMADRIQDIEVYGPEGVLITTVNSENVEDQKHVMADARLIAAAPEMLEMLKNLFEYLPPAKITTAAGFKREQARALLARVTNAA